MCQLDDLLSDTAGQFLESGHVWEAFSLTSYGFRAAVQCEMDDSDGGLTMLTETCHDLWNARLKPVAPELKAQGVPSGFRTPAGSQMTCARAFVGSPTRAVS